jgi:hypothetical protein
MRTLCAILLVLFTVIGSLYAEEGAKVTKRLIQLIYEEGYLVNVGEEDLLGVEIINPFYRYIGNIPKGKRVNVTDIKTKFIVQFSARQWIGGYEVMSETFIPVISSKGPDVGLDVNVELKGDTLFIKVSSVDKITDIFIQILSDIPIKISDDRTRYILSSVGVRGQNLKRGPEATFTLYLLSDQDFYTVPIQITYIFQGCVYDRVFTYSFKKEDFNHAS